MGYITVYDGANSIGGNKIYLDTGIDGIFLDFGKNFGKYSKFYEEFLKSRTTRGIHDLLYLELIPPLNIYRHDLTPRDVNLSSYPKLPISAVLLSHAHLDHAGNIGLLNTSVPVIASPMSIAILKGYQDIGKSGTEADVAYTSLRKPNAEDPLYLDTEKGSYKGRDFCCTSKPPERFLEFLSRKPGHEEMRTKKLEPGTCCPLSEKGLPFEITAYDVDHSIYGACGFVIRGESTIAYTGDFRLHGGNEQKTRDFAHHAKEATHLLIEGTRVRDEGLSDGSKVTEISVSEMCRKAVEESEGLVIADFSARNFERLEAFKKIAQQTDRELVITAKDLYMLYALWTVDGNERWKVVQVYDEIVDHKKRKWEGEVVRRLSGDKYITHDEIHKNPDQYLLSFSFYDMNHLLDINPDGGTYIYSSTEPFNEEMEIDFKRLWEWLTFFHIESCGFTITINTNGDYEPVIDKHYHASGHASGEDIEWVIDQIDPDVIIPIHTQARDWFIERYENVFLVDEGKKYEI